MLLVMAALSVVGLMSLPGLKVQYLPSTEGRSLTVTYSYPYASAESVEAEATSLIEGALAGLRGVTDIRSSSSKGSGSVTVTFRKGTDMSSARFEVASAIRNIRDDLPSDLCHAVVGFANPRLETKHHGARGVGQAQPVLAHNVVARRRLAMRAEEDVGIVERAQVPCLDDAKTLSAKTVNLAPIVDNVANTIDILAAVEPRLKSGYGPAHAEAETGMWVYLYVHFSIKPRWAKRLRMKSYCSCREMSLLSSSTASSALRRGLRARVLSCLSRSTTLARTSSKTGC